MVDVTFNGQPLVVQFGENTLAALAARAGAEAAAASVAKTANTATLIAAARTLGFFANQTHNTPSADLATITIGGLFAVSTINGASTFTPAIARSSSKISWPCGMLVLQGYNVGQETYCGRNSYNGSGYAGNGFTAQEFTHTGTTFDSLISDFYAQGPGNFRVYVNGKLAGTATVGTGSTNQLQWVNIAFPSSATRLIRIETNVPMGGLNVASAANIVSSAIARPLVTIMGDSFPEGTGASTGFNLTGEANTLANIMGWNPNIAGSGGTGILNAGTKCNFQNTTRLLDLTLSGVNDLITGSALAPVLGIVMGSGPNDVTLDSTSWGGAANYLEAVRKGTLVIINAWKAARPGKPLVFFGPTWRNSVPIPDVFTYRDGIEQACSAAGGIGANIWFIDRLNPNTATRSSLLNYLSTTGNTTTGSKVITNIPSTAALTFYGAISGPGIPTGARVLTIDSATQVTIDINATATATGAALLFRNDQTALYTSLSGGTPDNTHPSQAGHDYDGHWMARELRRLILSEFA